MDFSSANSALWNPIIQMGVLAGLILLANTLRRKIKLIRNSLMPTAVLAGFLLSKFFDVTLDGIIGLAVAVLIFVSGLSMARETVSLLLGRQADPELVEKITALVRSGEKVVGIHDLLVHDYGPGQFFASVHAQF